MPYLHDDEDEVATPYEKGTAVRKGMPKWAVAIIAALTTFGGYMISEMQPAEESEIQYQITVGCPCPVDSGSDDYL